MFTHTYVSAVTGKVMHDCGDCRNPLGVRPPRACPQCGKPVELSKADYAKFPRSDLGALGDTDIAGSGSVTINLSSENEAPVAFDGGLPKPETLSPVDLVNVEVSRALGEALHWLDTAVHDQQMAIQLLRLAAAKLLEAQWQERTDHA